MTEFKVPEEDGVEIETIEEEEEENEVETETIEVESEAVVEEAEIATTAEDIEIPIEETKELTPEELNIESSVAEELKFEIRSLYAKWQQGWFFFAKKVAEISANCSYEKMGYADFKEFCTEEFAELSYTDVVKMVSVVNHLGGAIEAFISTNPDSPIPARESLYLLRTSKDKAEKADDTVRQRQINALTAKVMSGDLSYHGLRQKIKDIETPKIEEKTETIEHPVEAAVENIEEASVAEVVEEEVVAEEEIQVEEGGEVSNILEIVEIIELGIVPVKENCDLLLNLLKGDKSIFTPEMKEAVDRIDQFSDYINEFLNEVVEITNT